MHPWLAGLIGGCMIGAAASLLLWSNGRIAGVSGILNGVLLPQRGDVRWRILFLAGLILAGGSYLWLVPQALSVRQEFPLGLLLLAGVLVGFGARMANGCTSGHGVCGLGRWSRRSLAAVMTFMATAMFTVFLVRHL